MNKIALGIVAVLTLGMAFLVGPTHDKPFDICANYRSHDFVNMADCRIAETQAVHDKCPAWSKTVLLAQQCKDAEYYVGKP